MFPLAAFLGHCVIQSSFLAPFTAAAALLGLFLAKLPGWAEQSSLLLGRHSTTIWLVHMFFYLVLFRRFAFSAKYPVLILVLMLAVCFASSWVIEILLRPVMTLLTKECHL